MGINFGCSQPHFGAAGKNPYATENIMANIKEGKMEEAAHVMQSISGETGVRKFISPEAAAVQLQMEQELAQMDPDSKEAKALKKVADLNDSYNKMMTGSLDIIG